MLALTLPLPSINTFPSCSPLNEIRHPRFDIPASISSVFGIEECIKPKTFHLLKIMEISSSYASLFESSPSSRWRTSNSITKWSELSQRWMTLIQFHSEQESILLPKPCCERAIAKRGGVRPTCDRRWCNFCFFHALLEKSPHNSIDTPAHSRDWSNKLSSSFVIYIWTPVIIRPW